MLGDDTLTDHGSPIAVSGMSSGVTTVATGGFRSVAAEDGGVYAWGDYYGELPKIFNATPPVAVTGLTSGVTTIAA